MTGIVIGTSCSPLPKVTATGLPKGVKVVTNGNGTATIYGTPAATQAGPYSATLTASIKVSGAMVQSTEPFTLTVDQPPLKYTSAKTATATAGSPFSANVQVLSYPPAALSITAGTLPTGLTFTDNGNGTGTIAGTADAVTGGGKYKLTISANNGYGVPKTQTYTLTVNQAPVFTSADSLSVPAGQVITPQFPVTVAAFPKPTRSVTGTFPPGVKVSPAGSIVGKPALGSEGVYTLTFKAINHNGAIINTTTQTFTLTVTS
jgi:hypothetical protein